MAVRASGTSLIAIFGVRPVIARTVTGDVGDQRRFPSADRFAANNGTASVEVSSGNRKTCRLTQRGNRQMNHAVQGSCATPTP